MVNYKFKVCKKCYNSKYTRCAFCGLSIEKKAAYKPTNKLQEKIGINYICKKCCSINVVECLICRKKNQNTIALANHSRICLKCIKENI